MILFHGGFGGLRVGDLVRPPEQTGAATLADYGAGKVCRRDRVYVTTDELAARVFAAFHPSGRGKAYEVEPIGDLENDADATRTGYSFQVPAARVVRVIQISKRERAGLVAAFAKGA